MAKNAVRMTVFVLILLGLLIPIENVLNTVWMYPRVVAGMGEVLHEFYEITEKSKIQTAYFGASGFLMDINPMEIYEDTGITSYNFSCGGQPLAVSYCLCQEMFKTQKPEVVILDGTWVFPGTFFDGGYHYLLDEMPLCKEKLELAAYYAKKYAQTKGESKKLDAFIGALWPIYQYHARWSSLNEVDFMPEEYGNLYRKGDYLSAEVLGSSMTIEKMDGIAQEMSSQSGWQISVGGGTTETVEDRGTLYMPALDEEQWEFVLKTKALCERNGAKLLLLKTPHFEVPLGEGAWSKIKSDIVKERAAQDGIEFLDLQYDVDLGLDWARDAAAGTQHLNWKGAKKVTIYLEDLLRNKYGLTGTVDAAYEDDLPLYHKAMQVLELQATEDLYSFLEKTKAMEDVSVLLAARDDMARGLNDDIRQALNDFGLQMDFSAMAYSDAYIAVMENGESRLEQMSNRGLVKSGTLTNGQAYTLRSRGYLLGSESSIKIDGKEYSRNTRGLNIVVLDNASGIVLDQVTFDTDDANRATVAVRTGGNRKNAFYAYDEYLRMRSGS